MMLTCHGRGSVNVLILACAASTVLVLGIVASFFFEKPLLPCLSVRMIWTQLSPPTWLLSGAFDRAPVNQGMTCLQSEGLLQNMKYFLWGPRLYKQFD